MTFEKAAAETSPLPTITSLIQTDESNRCVYATGEFEDHVTAGAGVDQALEKYIARFRTVDEKDPGKDGSVVRAIIADWLDPGHPALTAVTRDGDYRLLASGRVARSGIILMSIDITRQAYEAELARIAADRNPVPLWINDPETGEILYTNASGKKLFDVPDNDARFRISDFLEQDEKNREMLHRFEKAGRVDNIPVRARTYRGRDLWVIESAATTKLHDINVVVGAIQDLTDKSVIDKDTKFALDLLSDAIESLSEGFALYDEERRLVMCNSRYKDMNSAVADLLVPGVDWEIIMRETARRGVYADAIGREQEWVAERLESTHHYVDDFELEHTDGSWYLVSTHPTKLGGFAVTRTDITQKKNAELQQRDGDLLIRRVLESSPSPVVMARVGSGEIVYRSPAAQELFGKVDNAKDIYEDLSVRADYVTELLANGRVDDFKVRLRNGQGEMFSAAVYGRLAEYNGDEVVVTTTVDLTKREEAEAAIRQIVEACPVPIQMTVAETGEVLVASAETRALFGAADKAHSYYADPHERKRYIAELRKKGEVIDRKAEFVRVDGSRFWGAVSARLISFQGQDVIVSNTRDLTDEIALQNELDHQRELVFQNEKMSAMGELLAGVAHELNNPLSIVVGHSLMLREESADEETTRRIDKIGKAAERCSKIVKTFLAMARQQPSRMESIDLGSVIMTAVDVAGYGRQQENIAIVSKISPGLPEILADSDQITQVIINLVLNAGQAIKESGTGDRISVTTARRPGKNEIEIVVADNGPGIPESIRGRIFEPFFTTKEIGDGTGIGLAFCHRIIHSHGGEIWVEPNGDQGSRFHITLPIGKTSKSEKAGPDAKTDVSHDFRVLVVDDESDVAEFIAEVLKRDGYRVDVAGSGSRAVRMLEEGNYDALLSDLNMPDIDGRALFEVLEKSYPDLASSCAFVTGDTMGQASQKTLREANRPYLEKPVSPEELRRLVASLLDNKKEKQ